MNFKVFFRVVLLLFSSNYLIGQSLQDYKAFYKVNLSDFLLMGRITFEVEFSHIKKFKFPF